VAALPLAEQLAEAIQTNSLARLEQLLKASGDDCLQPCLPEVLKHSRALATTLAQVGWARLEKVSTPEQF
jgi:hypothetical protein